MILTEAKPWAEIRSDMIKWNMKRVVVVGCGSCSAACGTGGTEGIKKIIDNLKKDNITLLASIVINEPCDIRLVKKDLKHIENDIEAVKQVYDLLPSRGN